jgi:serine/threonine protein kinase
MSDVADKMMAELLPYAEAIAEERAWEIVDRLGAGASAATYELSTEQGKRALKIYHPRFLAGKEGEVTRRRFQIVLDHLKDHECPHLVRVYEGGSIQNTIYLLMDRAPGSALTKVLKLVPPEAIRNILRQVAIAAQYLEERKFCHRDIKSDNIVISDDYTHATLLDLGVIRWLDEEDGSGTDYGGQLPFVATARYSSPEYMFRLMPPGPELWRALTYYQLGAVLHDLLAREPIFEAVVQKAKDNRYLIAYAVATQIPAIPLSSDTPLDLVLLAQRALEKDPALRLANVNWSDFFGDDRRRRNEFLLGIRQSRPSSPQGGATTAVNEVSIELERALDERLVKEGAHCKHECQILGRNAANLIFTWTPSIETVPTESAVVVRISLELQPGTVTLRATAKLPDGSGSIHETNSKTSVTLPVRDDLDALLLEHSYNMFLDTSAEVVSLASSRAAGAQQS